MIYTLVAGIIYPNGSFEMRSSPINHIRGARDLNSSPYAGVSKHQSRQSPTRLFDSSPERNTAAYSETQYWRQRCRQLEAELLALNEDLIFQTRKNQSIEDLQDKIQELLAQNTHFVDENENLIRLIQQKNAEIEIWRKKFDSQFTHSTIAEAEKKKVFDHLNIRDQEHQVQIDRLLSEISRMQDQATVMENSKQLEITQLRNKYESETLSQIQNLKRSQYGNSELQQLTIRKLKDEIEQKNFDIENLRREARLQNQRLNGNIAFLENEIKKIETQNEHELALLHSKNQNARNNLLRTHRKNQEELKNLHEAKVKRLQYEIEEKKSELDDVHGKLRRSGKQNEGEMNRLCADKSKLRTEIKENDNRAASKVRDLNSTQQLVLISDSEATKQREANLTKFFELQLRTMEEVVSAKHAEIERLLTLNSNLRINEHERLRLFQENNAELKIKIREIIKHYEREVELMKIKVSQLYEADIDALRNSMANAFSTHNREAQNLRELLKKTRSDLAREVEDKMLLRVEYQNRLKQFQVKFERQNQQLHGLAALHEKQLQNQTSKASLAHIEHNDQFQKQGLDAKHIIAEKRALELQIENKNKEIEALNLRVEKMFGLHKREIQKLEGQLSKATGEYQEHLKKQQKDADQWYQERKESQDKLRQAALQNQAIKDDSKAQQDQLQRRIDDLRLEIASLKGTIEEYQNKVGHLTSKDKVNVANIEKTYLETQSLINEASQKKQKVTQREKELLNQQFVTKKSVLDKEIHDLKHENDILRDNYSKAQVREQQLNSQINKLLDSVKERNKLEEHVINIGLSNNYFKNVAEIFKRAIPE